MLYLIVVLVLWCGCATAEYKSCVADKLEAEEIFQEILSSSASDELSYFYVPRCDPVTGEWVALQQDSYNMRWCVVPETGEVISNKSNQLSSCTGCLASRLIILKNIEGAEKAGARINNVHFPDCQEEYPEYYEERQCWNGYFNACWCVDPRTGHATSYPTEADDIVCQHGTSSSTPTWCHVLVSLTTSYYDIYHTIKGLKHGEHGPTAQPDITMTVMCDTDGNFAEEQCVEDDCWCVEPTSGRVQSHCARHRRKRSLYTECQENRVQQLEAYYEFVTFGLMLEHFTIPKCTQLGGWDKLQCSNQTVGGALSCWCVDQLTGQQTTGASKDLRSCDTCNAYVLKATKAGIEDTTTCDETGQHYTVIQCRNEDDCWCVDHVSGRVLHRPPQGIVTGQECEIYDLQHNLKTRRN